MPCLRGKGKSKCNCVGGCLQKYNWIGGCTLNEKFIAMLSCFQFIKTLQMPNENHVFSTGDFVYLVRKSYVNVYRRTDMVKPVYPPTTSLRGV
jgi:hypothetical protein